MTNISNLCIKEAYNKGYRVVEGKVYNPNGKILSLVKTPSGYLNFGYYRKGKGKVRLRVHRMVAYQKYGDDTFKEGVECRHLDGNPENNLEDNVSIGTHSKNMMDVPKDDRVKRAKVASNAALKVTVKHDAERIKKVYAELKSYKKVMELFNISSKGTLSHILNKR